MERNMILEPRSIAVPRRKTRRRKASYWRVP